MEVLFVAILLGIIVNKKEAAKIAAIWCKTVKHGAYTSKIEWDETEEAKANTHRGTKAVETIELAACCSAGTPGATAKQIAAFRGAFNTLSGVQILPLSSPRQRKGWNAGGKDEIGTNTVLMSMVTGRAEARRRSREEDPCSAALNNGTVRPWGGRGWRAGARQSEGGFVPVVS